VRDVGRALDVPLNDVDRVAKLVPSGPKVHLSDAFENPEFRNLYDSQEYIREWIDMAAKVEGIARHAQRTRRRRCHHRQAYGGLYSPGPRAQGQLGYGRHPVSHVHH